MSKFLVTGGKELEGKVEVSGAKNAVLPIIAASLLTSDKIVLEEAPDLLDVQIMSQVIESLGGKIKRNGNKLSIFVDNLWNMYPEKLYEFE